jgi:beta-glucosidase
MKGRTYRYFTGDPLYPFGYGLSYSNFEYSGLKLSSPELEAGKPLTVDVGVKNTSNRAGDEVVELYVTFPKVPGAPLRALRSFKRIHVDGGQQQQVSFALQPRDLSYVNERGDRLVGAGDYVITVGGGQPATKAAHAETHLTIRGNQALPE